MPNSLLWIGLVAVWLFVLVPMLINRREPIRRTGDATLATRVLHRGGMARMVRRRPGRRSDPAWLRSNSRVTGGDSADDAVVDESTDEFADHGDETAEVEKADAVKSGDVKDTEVKAAEVKADETAGAGAAAAPVAPSGESSGGDGDSTPQPQPKPKIVSGATLADRMLGRTSMVVGDVDPETPAEAEKSAKVEESEVPTAKPDVDRRASETVAAELDQPGLDDPLPPPAPRRRGRGGFDPEADAAARAVRYASRQRTVVGLAVMALSTLALGLLVFSPLLWLHGVIDVLLVLYLTYLRRQVRMEQEIRRRRMARLARGRLDHAGRERRRGPVPERLRRPGAVVLEVDDEDPVFDHLEYYHPAVHRDMARASGQ